MPDTLEPSTLEFYRRALRALDGSKVDYLLGGAYAFRCCTGIERHTKDLDIFVRPLDVDRALAALDSVADRTEHTFPHWLAKAYDADGACVDVIYRSGNAVCEVDDAWFAHARRGEAFDLPVRLCPPEEILWTKAFVQERERFDGADVLHLIRAVDPMDWDRLLDRFGPHWRVLLAHLTMFGYVYPGDRDKVPARVLDELMGRLRSETGPGEAKLCRGTILSRSQYLIDIGEWGYRDARLLPGGRMTPEDVKAWTAGIDVDGSR